MLLLHTLELLLLARVEGDVLGELRAQMTRNLADDDRVAPGEIAHDGAQGGMVVVAPSLVSAGDASMPVVAGILGSDERAPLVRLVHSGSDADELP